MFAYQDQVGATYVLELDTGKKRQLVGALFAPSKPSWSANGKTIAIGALKPYGCCERRGHIHGACAFQVTQYPR
jgi:hypothetical protein